MNALSIEMIAPAKLRPSPTNPRKDVSPESLSELWESIKLHGVIQPLIVRPAWCVGWDGDPDDKPLRRDDSWYEVVAGHRRLAANELAGNRLLPCMIRDLSDVEALEMQWIENLQRKDLSPIDEADGYEAMLAMRVNGAPRYTVHDLAARIGRSTRYIYQVLKLVHAPDEVKDAVRSGTIGAMQASMIGQIPDRKLREKAAEEMLHPKYTEGPLTTRETERMIVEKFMQSLHKCGFDTEDVELYPAAGACSTCPKRAGNIPEFTAGQGQKGVRGDMCLDTACFRLKVEAAHNNWSVSVMNEAEHRAAMSVAEMEKELAGGIPRWNSKYVDLDQPWDDGDGGVTWRELTAGRDVPVKVARREDGSTVELVERELAKEAAKLNGYELQSSSSGGDDDEYDFKRLDELDGRIKQSILAAAPGWVADPLKFRAVVIAAGWPMRDALFQEKISGFDVQQLALELVGLLIENSVDSWSGEVTWRARVLADAFGVDVAKIEQELIAERACAAEDAEDAVRAQDAAPEPEVEPVAVAPKKRGRGRPRKSVEVAK